MEKVRDFRIDTVRGIACLLLVAYHLIGSGPTMGMRFAVGHWAHEVNETLALVRMPLFTILSGIVYAPRPATFAKAGGFIKGKALRLLLPLAFVGIPFAIIQKITPGANSDLSWSTALLVPVFPYMHFWFLQALFLVFLLVVLLEGFGLLASLPKALAVLAASLVLFALQRYVPTPFGLRKAFYLLPFFLSGVILMRFSRSIYRLEWATTLVVAVPALGMAIGYAAGSAALVDTMLLVVIGTAFAALLLLLTPPVPLLARIGFYSYTIYLFHVFGTAGMRIALTRIGTEDPLVVFVASMLGGVLLPIVVHLIVHPIPGLSRMLIGLRNSGGSRSSPPAAHRPKPAARA